MTLTAYARRREDDDFPGHIVIGKEGTESRYYGYRYDPALLPETVPVSGKDLFQFLFENAIPGMIFDETNFVKVWQSQPEKTYWKHAPWDGDLFAYVPISPDASYVQHGYYSFNPDLHPLEKQPCYNCVKWAHVISDAIIPGFIPAVKDWRMKNVIPYLNLMSEIPRSTDG